MQKHYVVVEPSPLCPFYVEGLQYIPAQSSPDGFTLLLMHAMNLHKETFDSFLYALMEDDKMASLLIKDAWCIDNPNSGRSSILNHKLLSTNEYKGICERASELFCFKATSNPTSNDSGSAFEYARAVRSFLCADSHGIDFRSRRTIGLAHSAGATSLMLLHGMELPSAFHGLILFDPGIFPPEKESSRVLCKMFGEWAKAKKDTWATRTYARDELTKHPTYSRWDPKLVELFIKYGLREVGDSEEVTLACSKEQEQAYFLKNIDGIDPPANVFMRLCDRGEPPIHLFVAEDDEYR
ncbi:hypothetical protein M422DRAFT_51654 [Sphaerobolus stellatus SS14]|uniref:AB hydrolase-1 domain-containing protein n=1 Tax=Sphaerobolus stellatus (strain SS14) TaxID=990650 RepID=A0A0C9VBZ7_SPHS4|nr:hypothetical protein M422DRAFT_51654 [Sphaerobolus stellatus SS14]